MTNCNYKKFLSGAMLFLLVAFCALFSACGSDKDGGNQYEETPNASAKKITITIGSTTFFATLEDNSSADALYEMLKLAPLTIEMSDYANFEKVGSLGVDLPRNDENVTTEAGDLILYQGRSFVIYYDVNNWTFTRLGKIDNVTQAQLKAALGAGDVTVTLSK